MVDATRQAEHFCFVVGEHERHFPLVADIEEHAGLSKARIADGVQRFCAHVELLSGQKPIIYTRGTFWNRYVGDVPWAKAHLLWIAIWSARREAPWGSPESSYRPKPWDTWTFWQKSADGNGRGAEFGARSGSICLDVFNGTNEDLLALSRRSMGLEPEPIAIPEDALERLWRYAVKQGWEV